MLVTGHKATIKTVKGYNAVNNDTNHNSVFKSHTIYDNIVTKVEVGCLRNKGSIPSRGKRFFFSPKHLDQIWDSPNFLFNGYWGLCTQK
jgi:hypothetical protein